jgi:hypothetical protein
MTVILHLYIVLACLVLYCLLHNQLLRKVSSYPQATAAPTGHVPFQFVLAAQQSYLGPKHPTSLLHFHVLKCAQDLHGVAKKHEN